MNEELLEKVSLILNKDKKYFALKTGFNELDKHLFEIKNGSLITIGGRPAIGKRSFAYSVMLNLLEQNKNCILFSLDRSDTQVIKYLLAQDKEVNLEKIFKSNLETADLEKITESMNKFKNYNLTIYDSTSMTISKIKENIKKCKPEYVFIDYFQLIRINKGLINEKASANIANELKSIAKDNNCIIFVLSQISRATESRNDKRPLLCDIKNQTLEDVSDVVMFIYREAYYSYEEEHEESAEIIIAKNKFGFTGIINLLFKKQFAKFVNSIETDIF